MVADDTNLTRAASVRGLDKSRKFVLASEMLKEQGVLKEQGLVGIGIAFIVDDLGRFIISHAVGGGPAANASLREGDIITHCDGVPLAEAKGAADLALKLLGPQRSKVQLVVRDMLETSERLVELERRPLPSSFLLDLAADLDDDAISPASGDSAADRPRQAPKSILKSSQV